MSESAEREAEPAGMPGDRGLPVLGLMMQLWGGVDALLHVVFLMFLMQFPVTPKTSALVLSGAAIVRAVTLFVAGQELRAGGLRILSRVRAVLVVSILYQGVLLATSDGPLGERVVLSLDVIAWPLFLAVVFHTPAWRERLRLVGEGELQLRDANRSIEAVGAMMVVLGTVGLVILGALAWMLLDSPMKWWRSSPGDRSLFLGRPEVDVASLLLLSAAAVGVRGLVHVGVGVLAMLGATPSRFYRGIQLYVRVVWASLAVAVLPLLYGLVKQAPFMGTLTVAVVTTLSVWPLALRGYSRQVSGDFGEEQEDDFTRAPDGGLVSAGWLVCAIAVGSILPAVMVLSRGPGYRVGAGLMATPSWFIDGSLPVWSGLLGVAVALWAGLEIIAYTKRARIAALVFASVTAGLAIGSRWEMLDAVGHWERFSGLSPSQAVIRADLLLSLVFPLIVVLLAARGARRAR